MLVACWCREAHQESRANDSKQRRLLGGNPRYVCNYIYCECEKHLNINELDIINFIYFNLLVNQDYLFEKK